MVSDVRATDDAGWTPLHVDAGCTNNPDMIHAIVGAPHGLDVLNACSDDGYTPLWPESYAY